LINTWNNRSKYIQILCCAVEDNQTADFIKLKGRDYTGKFYAFPRHVVKSCLVIKSP